MVDQQHYGFGSGNGLFQRAYRFSPRHAPVRREGFEGPDSGPARHQQPDDLDRRTLAQVIDSRFVGQPEGGDSPALQPAEGGLDEFGGVGRLSVVDRPGLLNERSELRGRSTKNQGSTTMQ